MTEATDPVDVGHAIFALHDPLRGRERDFNRWYERDHMYVGGILAPWTIGAARWVATAPLKARRFGSGPFGPITDGSYLAAYWIQRDRLADQQKWVADQLTGASRFGDKTVQTATTYDRVSAWRRDADGPPLFLALAHGYRGLAWLVLQRGGDTDIADLSRWLFDEYAREHWSASTVASAIAFAPRPKEPWWPPAAPEVEGVGDRLMVACFLEEDPSSCWDGLFAPLAAEISSVGEVLFAGPFIPTVVGTDRYCDELTP
jgi:hypothetical protein